MTPPRWPIRSLAVAVALSAIAVVTSPERADAQPPGTLHPVAPAGQPKAADPKAAPKSDPKPANPKHPVRPIETMKHPNPPAPNLRPLGSPPPAIVYPQINGMPGFIANPLNQTFYNPAPFPGPFMNPFSNPYTNPFSTTALSFNSTLTVLSAPGPFANPFANPFAANYLVNPLFVSPFNNPYTNPYGLFTTYSPTISVRQPGELIWRGPDLQVNPWAGTVFKPLTGIARTADGSTFYRIPGSDQYFDPTHATFFNPTTGVIARPGGNLFLP